MNDNDKNEDNKEIDEKSMQNESSEELESDDETLNNSRPSRKTFILFGIAAIAAAPLGLGTGYLLKTKSEAKDAKNTLFNFESKRGKLQPVNTKLKVFKGQVLEGANTEQKALTGGSNNNAEEAAVFIFGNGKENDKKIMDIYLDFDSQRSRDFLLINQTTLKSLVESGTIELRLHPVSSGSALSMYSPEALAETFVKSPDKAWSLLISTMKLSAESQANAELDVLEALVGKIEELNISDVTSETIQNGTFSGWIIKVGDDNKLQTGYYPPIVYLNDAVIDPDKVDFNDATTFQRYVIEQE